MAKSILQFANPNVLHYGNDDVETGLLAAIANANVTDIYIPPGTYTINSQIAPPSSGEGVPTQRTIRIHGSGGHASGQGRTPLGGTVLDLRYNGPKILTKGAGLLEIDNITLADGGSDSNTIIHCTNTTLWIHHCGFNGTGNTQDAIVLGGTTVPTDGTDNSAFSGYGTIIESNFFNRIRRAVYGRTYANSVVVAHNTVWQHAGTNLANGACIEFDGGASIDVGNYIAGNLIEMCGYVYGIKLINALENPIIGNSFYDDGVSALAHIRLENSTLNTILAGFHGNVPLISEDAASLGKNTIIDANNGGEIKFSPDGTAYKIVVANGGAISATEVTL